MLSYESSVRLISGSMENFDKIAQTKDKSPDEQFDALVHLIFNTYELIFDVVSKEAPDKMLRDMAAKTLKEFQIGDIEVGVMLAKAKEAAADGQ